jgi:hypothetical protein
MDIDVMFKPFKRTLNYRNVIEMLIHIACVQCSGFQYTHHDHRVINCPGKKKTNRTDAPIASLSNGSNSKGKKNNKTAEIKKTEAARSSKVRSRKHTTIGAQSALMSRLVCAHVFPLRFDGSQI